jgi:hypothetical protein
MGSSLRGEALEERQRARRSSQKAKVKAADPLSPAVRHELRGKNRLSFFVHEYGLEHASVLTFAF